MTFTFKRGEGVGVGARIREARDRLKMTQDQVAELSGVSKGFISDVENEKRQPGAEYLLRIANALGASIDYLLRGEDRDKNFAAPVVVPRELSEVAEELGLSYAETMQLLEAHDAVVARRGGRSGRFTVDDWRRLFRALEPFMRK